MYEEKEIKYKKRKPEKRKNFNLKKEVKIQTPNFINNINWKQLFIKLCILIIIMVLIIFIISRINKNNKEKNLILNNNINTLIESTLAYYNDENLPQNDGDSTSMLLDEMIKKKIVNEIKDKNNKECSHTDSYIIITKTNSDNYQLKVHLSCSKENITLEKELICTKDCRIKK